MTDKVSLRPLDEGNWMQALEIEHGSEQGEYIADADEILALAYVGRHRNSAIAAIYADETMVGLMLVEDAAEEARCCCLHELLIDRHHQGKGYASEALRLLFKQLLREKRFDCVRVGVHRENAAAIHVYKKAGFIMAEHLSPQYPEDVVMVYRLD